MSEGYIEIALNSKFIDSLEIRDIWQNQAGQTKI
jgi:hypothetical protein